MQDWRLAICLHSELHASLGCSSIANHHHCSKMSQVQVEATAERPWILACGSLWQLLGTAIAASADGSPARDSLVQRLVDGAARLSSRYGAEAVWLRMLVDA